MARILLWHGYLLSGSGSNIYTANTARVWRAHGHDVLVMCQDSRAHEHGFVDEVGGFGPDNDHLETVPTGAAPGPGRCRVARPDIGALLPVYVLDHYDGFHARRFVDLTDAELDTYTAANVTALVTAIESHRPEAIIVGHEVMGPYIAKQACSCTGTGYLAKLHGSALEYAVKLQQRYLRFAVEGLGAAGAVVGGSEYMIEEASATVPGWRQRAVVVNPGCDVDLFRPAPRSAREGPVVGFVGKLIAAKGVHNLLASLGLTATRNLGVEIVGYGGFERELRLLGAALASRNAGRAEAVAELGQGAPLEALWSFLRARRADAAYWSRAGSVPVTWHGRLDHAPLSVVLPTFDLLVVPSVVPEAFGMVAAEGAACGVLPVVPRHSGIGEVGAALEADLGTPGLLTYDPASPIEGIAEAVDRVLGLEPSDRADLERRAVIVARRRWSWQRVGERLLELAEAHV